MVEIVGDISDEEDLYLCRYMPLKSFDRLFVDDDCMAINFTRVSLFDDILEGWNTSQIGMTKSWIDFISFLTRVQEDEGTFEGGLQLLRNLNTLHGFKAESTELDITSLIRSYIDLVNNNYASCWFISNSKSFEERYMWNIYGNSRKETAFMITLKWTDLKKHLAHLNEMDFRCGKIEYYEKSDKYLLFQKDQSYSHEKEFRIITKNFENDYNILKIPRIIEKNILFSKVPPSSFFQKYQQILEMNTCQINTSALPMSLKVESLQFYLNHKG